MVRHDQDRLRQPFGDLADQPRQKPAAGPVEPGVRLVQQQQGALGGSTEDRSEAPQTALTSPMGISG
jgi:hypothetical protein